MSQLAHYIAYLGDFILERRDVRLLFSAHSPLAVAIVCQDAAYLASSGVLQTFGGLRIIFLAEMLLGPVIEGRQRSQASLEGL